MEKELPNRKPTRHKNHDYSTSGAYFVTICVKNREKILSKIEFNFENRNVNVNLTDIGKNIEENLLKSPNIPGVIIDKYVIMPDHIHAIIVLKNTSADTGRQGAAPYEYAEKENKSVGDGALDIPQNIKEATNEKLPQVVSAFKKFCNKQIGYNIFQRGYYDHIIRDREDYETRCKYIYENPMRWYYR